jgi:hypothetical protein
MIRDTHTRRVLLCIGTTVPLGATWVLAYQAATGTTTIPTVPVVLGLATGVLTVIVAVVTAGYPTDRKPTERRHDRGTSTHEPTGGRPTGGYGRSMNGCGSGRVEEEAHRTEGEL